ncbi:hypothetical protein CTheo_8539 [Ceratobasidium theobromae]|uniref:Uncharacterized protein n=1 Tax=Ceratobasidium theobromae TaxID=1582974 RepID=A0A5N5Q9B7_9AGAM|nr:hypothetical protein CTheo_8539 [Ceratobasidium theobromae]
MRPHQSTESNLDSWVSPEGFAMIPDHHGVPQPHTMLPCPKGVITNLQAQIELEDSGSDGVDSDQQEDEVDGVKKPRKSEMYDDIRRFIRYTVNGILTPEQHSLHWAQIPAHLKVIVYEQAVESHPYLQRFIDSWASEEMMKSILQNGHDSSVRRSKHWNTVHHAHKWQRSASHNNAASNSPTNPPSIGDNELDQSDQEEVTMGMEPTHQDTPGQSSKAESTEQSEAESNTSEMHSEQPTKSRNRPEKKSIMSTSKSVSHKGVTVPKAKKQPKNPKVTTLASKKGKSKEKPKVTHREPSPASSEGSWGEQYNAEISALEVPVQVNQPKKKKAQDSTTKGTGASEVLEAASASTSMSINDTSTAKAPWTSKPKPYPKIQPPPPIGQDGILPGDGATESHSKASGSTKKRYSNMQ